MVWPIIRRCLAFGWPHLTDAAFASQRTEAKARVCPTENTCPVSVYRKERDISRFVGKPEASQKRHFEEINSDVREADFWPGISSGFPFLSSWCSLLSHLAAIPSA